MVVVRIPRGGKLVLSTALDAGAAAIVIPHVESVEEVKDIIKEMYFRRSRRNTYSLHSAKRS
jgi:4-hydroxy-2-oxoheptanedioate aldolase